MTVLASHRQLTIPARNRGTVKRFLVLPPTSPTLPLSHCSPIWMCMIRILDAFAVGFPFRELLRTVFWHLAFLRIDDDCLNSASWHTGGKILAWKSKKSFNQSCPAGHPYLILPSGFHCLGKNRAGCHAVVDLTCETYATNPQVIFSLLTR